MQVELPELESPAKLRLDLDHPLSDKAYFDFCAANPDLRLERTAQGEIIIVPPAGFESMFREGRVFRHLDRWAERDGRGEACGPSAQFILPSGAARSPDAAWVSKERIARLTKDERLVFQGSFPNLSSR